MNEYGAYPVALEHDEQVAFMQYVAWMTHQWPELTDLHAIPNGGLRDKVVAAKLTAEGVKKGIPDLFLPAMRVRSDAVGKNPFGSLIEKIVYGGLYIEMKRAPPKYKIPSATQLEVHKRLISQGYCVKVAKGADHAIEILNSYLKGEF